MADVSTRGTEPSGKPEGRVHPSGDSFQVYFSSASAGGRSGEATKRHDAVDAWLVAHGLAVEANR
jgi:hypothetical protein